MGSHDIFKSLIKYPPSNVEYQVSNLSSSFSRSSLIGGKVKKFIWSNYTKHRPPNTSLDTKNVDLIHSTAGILINNRQPWVVDVENLWSFFNFHYEKMSSEKYVNIIYRYLSSDYCRKIIPHSIAGMKTILNFKNFSNFKNKMEVVYPAIESTRLRKKKDPKNVKILFIGKRFLEKGGLEVIDAFKILNKKYDAKLTMITNIPRNIKNKIKSSEIFIHDNSLPKTDLMKIYKDSDIFIFPSFVDTFGLVILEAMNYNLPVIASDIFAIPEIVTHNKTGLIVKSPTKWYNKKFQFVYRDWNDYLRFLRESDKSRFVKSLVSSTEKLIESSSLRKRMGKNGKREIEKGKFSIKSRNKKLKRIYEESLKY